MSIQLDVTATFVALCAVIIFVMVSAVGFRRSAIGVLRGDGGDPILFKRSRLHGNFVEVAPITALALLVAELTGVPERWLWIAVASFFVGRIYHGVRYDARDRGVGMALTVMPSVVLGITVFYRHFAS